MKARKKSRWRSLRTLTVALRALLHPWRHEASNHLLAVILAGIAGAVNAGGFFVIGQYTSHMTGYLSQVADALALHRLDIVAASALAILAFVAGAASSAFLINWGRQSRIHQQYAWPIAVQGGVLLALALTDTLGLHIGRLPLLCGLSFIMGMQNASITKLSGARIRTTHATGMVTDIGIEIGRAVYGRFVPGSHVHADRTKLNTLLQLVFTFLAGGIVGAVGFATFKFLFAFPIAALLIVLSLPSLRARRVVRPGPPRRRELA